MKQQLAALFLVVVLAASVLTAADLAAASTATAATTRTATTLDLHVTHSANLYTFYGTLSKTKGMSGITGGKVELQVSADNEHWRDALLPTRTNAVGNYTFHLPLQPGHMYYFRTSFAGSEMYLHAFSPVVTVPAPTNSEPIPTTLTLRAEKGWNVFVTHWDFYGTLTANGKPIPYANIGIEYCYKRPDGQMLWVLQQVIKTDKNGNYHWSEWYYFSVDYYYRSWFEGPSEFPEYAEAYSPIVMVSI